MTYDLLVFAHVLAAIVWIGAGLLVQLLVSLADRSQDLAFFSALVRHVARLSLTVFVPASLAVLVFGVLAVLNGPRSFDQLWIVIALVGFATTFLMGALVFKPRSDELAAAMGDDGEPLTPEAQTQARRLLRLARLDYVVLVIVVFDMVLKPTAQDTTALVTMAATLLLGAATTLRPATARAHTSEPTTLQTGA